MDASNDQLSNVSEGETLNNQPVNLAEDSNTSNQSVDEDMLLADENPKEDEIVKNKLAQLEFEVQWIAEGASKIESKGLAETEFSDLMSLKRRYDETFLTGEITGLFERRKSFLSAFRDAKEVLLGKIGEKPKSTSHGVDPRVEHQSPFKLPQFDVPKFYGKIETWAAFKTDFLNLLDDSRVKDNDHAKRRYLTMALKGEAESLIANMKESPFDECWKIVTATYDQPFRRAQMHMEYLQKRKTLGERNVSLRSMLVEHRQHSSGLRLALNELKVDAYEMLVISSFLDQVSQPVRLAWEKEVGEKGAKHCSLKNFYSFIERECGALERAAKGQQRSQSLPARPESGNKSSIKKKGTVMVVKQKSQRSPKPPLKCHICGEAHFLSACKQYREMNKTERAKFVTENAFCRICLTKTCDGAKDPKRCARKFFMCPCKGYHHSTLHIRNAAERETATGEFFESIIGSNCGNSFNKTSLEPKLHKPSFLCKVNKIVASSLLTHNERQSLLTTSLVKVMFDKFQVPREVRAFLDNGSQINFITSALVDILQAEVVEILCEINGIFGEAGSVAKCTKIIIQSCHTNFQMEITAYVVDCILDSMIPSDYFDISSWNVPPHITLADPCFNVPAHIDLLLNLDVFWKVLGNRTLHLGVNLPTLRDTDLGWIVAGSLQLTNQAENKFVFCVHRDNEALLKSMERFWTYESFDNLPFPLNEEEKACEHFFSETTFQRADGRFVVKLPFKMSPEVLGDSRTQALKQFYYLEKRLQNNPTLCEQYVACMSEYISLGHMREVQDTEMNVTPSYYLPHHAVMKESSTSTACRVVFNASMKTTSGLSLNDILMLGPVVQPDLFSTVLTFRTHKYVFVTDIRMMYRMVCMHPDCAPFQRIFWRSSSSEKLKVYQLETVTFGTKSAPYLATRCLKELALKYGDHFPAAKQVLLNNFYVDDCLGGADTIESALVVQRELRELLAKGGFQLSKWCSNEPKILAGIEKEHIESNFPLSLGETKTIKTLGVLWLPTEDAFQFRFADGLANEITSMRHVLSAISGFYDILGIFGPTIVFGKCLMQSIWSWVRLECENCSKGKQTFWDKRLPDELLEAWKKFSQSLHCLSDVNITRFISHTRTNLFFELHGFADTSSKAYGAAIYSRTVDDLGQVHVQLLCSKSKVAPLQQLSIARLELKAALLLAELTQKVRVALSKNLKIDRIRLWSDSKVTLAWIASESIKWNVFVAHRVSKIQSLTADCIWDHVDSESNPADILSRSALPAELKRSTLFFNGPEWLSSHNEPWNELTSYQPNKNETLERKAIQFSFSVQTRLSSLFSLVEEPMTGKWSTTVGLRQGLTKLVRITAWIQRFLLQSKPQSDKLSKPCLKCASAHYVGKCPIFQNMTDSESSRFLTELIKNGTLSIEEYQAALDTLIKLAQMESFSQEIKMLKAKGKLNKDSKLHSLCVFLDSKGILRVGGRLENSELSWDERHPIVLHPEHKLSKLIVWYEHLSHLHAGARLLKAAINKRYWILRLNSLVRKCIIRCHTCITLKAKAQEEMMANLPRQRVVPSKAFHITGVDYAGPYTIIGKGGRHRVYVKSYVAIFVCFSTKAVHLELVSDLTTQAFLATLTRFVSRRAIPAEIHSDNGTTFVGANSELKRLHTFLEEHQREISEFALSKGINWLFIPPSASHFGGLWESAVKSMKSHLKTVLWERTFTFEELTTLLAQVEACLNSRPLTPLSADPDELGVLTPGHFLVGGPLTALPTEPLLDLPENRVKLYLRREKAMQLFWKRWSMEYLNTLQQRSKWRITKDELRVNDLVLIIEENTPPLTWRKGRIQELHKGKDGLSRVATVKTEAGSFKRPIVKLVYLPTD